MKDNIFTVSQFVATVNQILDYSVPFVRINGEVSNFKVSQNKWVSFRLKDETAIVECFMGIWQLRHPIEDGMTVVVSGNPRLNGKWGKFSISVQSVLPEGEGAQRRAYELLKKKLTREGLFSLDRKRLLPEYPETIGLVSSEQAAGYADFVKIMRHRWPLAAINFVHVAVQGADSADQVTEAIDLLNQQAHPPEMIAIVRGGGAAEDLASFNDELVVRAIAASRVPVVVGVGHEVDETLSSLAADVAASTPSNAAELIAPDMNEVQNRVTGHIRTQQQSLSYLLQNMRSDIRHFTSLMQRVVHYQQETLRYVRYRLQSSFTAQLSKTHQTLRSFDRLLTQLHPKRQLERGFAIVRKGKIIRSKTQLSSGDSVTIEFKDGVVDAQTKM